MDRGTVTVEKSEGLSLKTEGNDSETPKVSKGLNFVQSEYQRSHLVAHIAPDFLSKQQL